jgi:signal transduction histidine kinase
MLERIGPSGPYHEEMQDILADVKDIESIVRGVLDFAHPGKSQVREVAIGDVVKEVLRFSKLPLRHQDIRLRTNLRKPATRVKVDAVQMRQVFFNIIRNACDAMPEGGELRVSTSRPAGTNRQVRVDVEDTGPGIAKEHMEFIFDPFFSARHDGTGLGLAICRKIVEGHGGRIEVKSTPGKGARFGVVLPTV